MSEHLSRNYVSGSAEDREALRDRLAQIYKLSNFVVIGSIGRQAMYASFGWNVEPLSLRQVVPFLSANGLEHLSELRDIDAVCPARKTPAPYGLYDLDTQADLVFGVREARQPYTIWDESTKKDILIEQRVVRPRTRLLDGMPVRTFSVGTHWRFEQYLRSVLPSHPDKQCKYDHALQAFGEFAEAMHEQHPREFLAPEYYEPFQQVINHLGDNRQ